ncbi:hypothetical protein GQ55_1G428600 [Panicum hallii var. hallii]|uniref:Uncharacterized protein n=1 Tax=Panicum hallii var. hallii TaxID=1504633 RepID=A0A2T7FDJ0_9POAL|nr:hypothetical protein GQ55_1G428600 [Panicum hallii var. hallii]
MAGSSAVPAMQGYDELAGAARTRTPSTTNYDVHSPTWGDGRPAHPPSAMWATDLGHEPS